MGTLFPRSSTEPIPTLRVTPEAPPLEDLGTSSSTTSEVESTMNHRQRKASLRNSTFSSQEFNALSLVDAYLGAIRFVFQKALDVLSRGL